jgi:hypothetical protein
MVLLSTLSTSALYGPSEKSVSHTTFFNNDMSIQAAQPEKTAPLPSADTFFTEMIVGMPVCLPLGRRHALHHQPGISYAPGLGMRMAQFWQADLENEAWRYALPMRAPVQSKTSRWRVFLERHALRLAFLALLGLLAVFAAGLALVWHSGLLHSVFAGWAQA